MYDTVQGFKMKKLKRTRSRQDRISRLRFVIIFSTLINVKGLIFPLSRASILIIGCALMIRRRGKLLKIEQSMQQIYNKSLAALIEKHNSHSANYGGHGPSRRLLQSCVFQESDSSTQHTPWGNFCNSITSCRYVRLTLYSEDW